MERVAHIIGAGEGNGLDLGSIHEGIADFPAGTGDEVDDTFGDAGFMQSFHDAPGAKGRNGGGLDDDGVATDERRGHLPGRDGDGEVPGRDETNDADRLADGEDVDAFAFRRDHDAIEARPFAAEVAEDVDGTTHFTLGFGERLAFFARHFRADHVEFLFEDLGGLIEDVAAGRRGHTCPAGERRFSSLGGGFHIGG